MKTFTEQNQELVEFDKTFDSSKSADCVKRAMLLLLNRKAQMEEEDYVWPYRSLAAMVHACTLTVRYRNEKETGETMMAAAMRFVGDREADLDMYRVVTDNLNAKIERGIYELDEEELAEGYKYDEAGNVICPDLKTLEKMKTEVLADDKQESSK